VRFADFEGITYNPETNLLYVAVEGEELILEVSPQDFSLLRQFSIERFYGDELLLKPGGQGVEAITFVPDPNHEQGGTFYLANQSLGDDEDLSLIIEVVAPLHSDAAEPLTAQVVKVLPMDTLDLSGLQYDPACGHLLVISDSANTILEVTLSGDVSGAYTLPGVDQEGITVDDLGNFYIAQDSGEIRQAKWDQ